MESTLLSLSSTMSILSFTKSINPRSTALLSNFYRCYCTTRPSALAHLKLSRCLLDKDFKRLGSRNVVLGFPRSRLQCSGSAAASFTSNGGGFGGIDGTGGGRGGDGDGAADGGESKPRSVVAGARDGSASSPDVIILDVGGMTCGGCAASVKRILESQPQVSSASVNLTTETAIVWPVSEVTIAPNWQKDLGDALAKYLTNCGFASNLRDSRTKIMQWRRLSLFAEGNMALPHS